MRLKCIAALLGCASAVFGSYVQAEEVDLYIFAGQSNADGRALTTDLPDNSPFASPQDALIWYANPNSDDQTIALRSNGFEALAPGFSNPPPAFGGPATQLPATTFGPELSFASAITEATGSTNQVAIVKVAEGGTSIREQDGEWHGDLNDNPGFAFTTLLNEVNSAVTALEADGKTVNIQAVVWHQGEADRDFPFYIPNLEELITSVRAEFGEDLAFVAGELSIDGREDNITFNNNITSFVDDTEDDFENLGLVSSLDLVTTDTTHFDAASQLELGRRYAQAVAGIIAVPEPSTACLLGATALAFVRRTRRA